MTLTLTELTAAVFTVAVERISLDQALRRLNFSQAELMEQALSGESSPAALRYAKEILAKKIDAVTRDTNDSLYLVKKVFCSPDDYERAAAAVSGEDAEQFKVVRAIGSHRDLLGYKGSLLGLEAYLVASKSPLLALRRTATIEPTFYVGSSHNFDAEEIEIIDTLLTEAIQIHTPEAVGKLFNAVG